MTFDDVANASAQAVGHPLALVVVCVAIIVSHLALGVRVALGSDVGAGTGFSLFKEGLQAYFVQQLLGREGHRLTAAHLLWLASSAGAEVLGIDIAANLVAAGRARAAAEGLANLRFEEGDASNLAGIADGRFDFVLSLFGAMFAPRPLDVAREMVRVTRPGGRIVMGNWIPGDPTLVAQILKTSAAYSPPPPEGFVSPMLWGQEEHVRARFAAAGIEDVICERDTFVFRHSGPPADFVAHFRDYYGPTMNAFDAAEAGGRRAELDDELVALFERENTSPDPGTTDIPATFLRVTVEL